MIPPLVRRHVEVEVAVAVHVGQRQRRRREARRQAARGGVVGEAAASVAPQHERPAVRTDEQVEVAVPVHVRDGRPARAGGECAEPRLGGDIGEAEVALVAVERPAALGGGQEDVGPAVAGDIADCRSGAEQQVPVRQRALVIHRVHQRQPARRAVERVEALVARDDEGAPASFGDHAPRRVGRPAARRGERQRDGGAKRARAKSAMYSPIVTPSTMAGK